MWRNHPFPDVDVGEDTFFVMQADPSRIAPATDELIHIGLIHSSNVSPKLTHEAWWQTLPIADVRSAMGADWYAYQLSPTDRREPMPASVESSAPPVRRQPGPMAVAHEADLGLAEFGAFNYGQNLPRMRRWELPFVMFQSRLGNTTSVLDCTINPVALEARLSLLYPHVMYRHVSPVNDGRFELPVGVPDRAFDR